MAYFGNNSLIVSRGSFVMNLYDGGQWSFDGKEIDALDSALNSFQYQDYLVETKVPRSKSQSDVLLRRVLTVMCLEEGGRVGHFPTSKITELRAAIKAEKAKA